MAEKTMILHTMTFFKLFIDMQMRNEQINQILKHNLRFNGSYQSMQSMARDVVNTTPGATVKVPATMYKLRKTVTPIFEYQMHYKCVMCGNYSINANECDECQAKTISSRSEYYAHIPIKQQLIQSLRSDLSEIITYYESVLAEDQISDIHNGQCFKNIRSKYPESIILPLIVNELFMAAADIPNVPSPTQTIFARKYFSSRSKFC